MRRWNDPRVRAAFLGLVAVVAGLFAVRLFREQERRLTGAEPMVTVFTAKRFLPAGVSLTPADVVPRRLPARYAEPKSVEAEALLRLSPPPRTRIGLLKGEQITRSKLTSDPSALGLAWKVEAGAVAVGLRLAPEDAAGGWLQPDDRVDVLVARRKSGGPARRLAESVRVLATSARPPGAPEITGVSIADQPVVVTLMATPDQAAQLAAVTGEERVSLALRSADDAPLTSGSEDR